MLRDVAELDLSIEELADGLPRGARSPYAFAADVGSPGDQRSDFGLTSSAEVAPPLGWVISASSPPSCATGALDDLVHALVAHPHGFCHLAQRGPLKMQAPDDVVQLGRSHLHVPGCVRHAACCFLSLTYECGGSHSSTTLDKGVFGKAPRRRPWQRPSALHRFSPRTYGRLVPRPSEARRLKI